jgi:uncharacterized membrane protein YphA (DoxX/SURF4 family)
MKINIKNLDLKLIEWLRISFMPVARISIFIVYFYFGILKLFGESPASPLATALTEKTIGLQYFHTSFVILAIFECLIGVLFLFPKATRIVIPMLFIHMAVVCSPLFLVPAEAFVKPFVPTLEGQYIIKNIVIIAVAIGIAAQTRPLMHQGKRTS